MDEQFLQLVATFVFASCFLPSLDAQTLHPATATDSLTIDEPSINEPALEVLDLGPLEEPADRIEKCETRNACENADIKSNCLFALVAATGFAAGKLVDAVREMGPLPSGLTRSRWAMDDPEYAAKYASGADKSDIVGKVKQASDARFIDGSSGWYMSGGLTSLAESEHSLASIEAGYEGYWTSYLTSRIGIIGAINDNDGYIGAETGLRLQTPTRLAPFVGAGLFGGFASQSVPANNDGIDNDQDKIIDEFDEEQFRLSGSLIGVYPEIGLHFWWSPRVRLTGFYRYLITTEGRDADSWLCGFGIALMSGN